MQVHHQYKNNSGWLERRSTPGAWTEFESDKGSFLSPFYKGVRAKGLRNEPFYGSKNGVLKRIVVVVVVHRIWA